MLNSPFLMTSKPKEVGGSKSKVLGLFFFSYFPLLKYLSQNWTTIKESSLMCGSCHIGSVLIGVEYRNCCWTLDVYLLFVTLLGQIQSKQNYSLVTYKVASP